MAAQSLPSMSRQLRRFLAWWGGELRGMLPVPRAPHRAMPDALLVDATGPALRLSLRQRGKERSLGALEAGLSADPRRGRRRALPVHLRIADDIVLRRTLTLPLDAEATLRQAIAFQIDGLTPFKRDEVCFGYRIDARDHAARLLRVTVAAVPSDRLAEAIEGARGHGLRVAAVETDADGAPVLIPVEEPGEAPAGGKGAARLFVLLACLAALLAGVAAYLPFHRLQQRIGALNGAIETARDNALATGRLRKKLASIGETSRFIAGRKAPGTLLVDLMEELTRRLPDSVWLTDFQADGKEIVISGFAGNASSVLGILEASPMLAGAKFRSPVTRAGKENIERFELSAGIVRRPAK